MRSLDIKPAVSIGIIARNEVGTIERTLESLFKQTLFAQMEERGRCAEILCVVNGSTDATAETVDGIFRQTCRTHPNRKAFKTRVDQVSKAGKLNAWNEFVHKLSHSDTSILILMDADIEFVHLTALFNLFTALEGNASAMASIGRPSKDLTVKPQLTIRERLSLSTSQMTQADPNQLTGQLYAIRSSVARRIRMPQDLNSCDDGLIKNLLCTNFGTSPSANGQIIQVADASHHFEAYLSLGEVLKNQKRQIIAQTILHILLDQFLPTVPETERKDFNRLIIEMEQEDPNWLRKRLQAHLRRNRFFWQLFPALLTFRFRRLARLSPAMRLRCLPAAIAGSMVTLLSSWMAARTLRSGTFDYWPDRSKDKAHFTLNSVDATTRRPSGQ